MTIRPYVRASAQPDFFERTRRGVTRRCQVCGCTEDKACRTGDGPCFWVGPTLCSACEEEPL